MHALDIARDVLGGSTDKVWRLSEAQKAVEAAGAGIIVLIDPTSGADQSI